MVAYIPDSTWLEKDSWGGCQYEWPGESALEETPFRGWEVELTAEFLTDNISLQVCFVKKKIGHSLLSQSRTFN